MLRQSLAFFQNDFAGRIANKIMQTGPSLRESVVQSVDALWFVCIYTVSALVLFVQLDPRLALPLIIWLVAFCRFACLFRSAGEKPGDGSFGGAFDADRADRGQLYEYPHSEALSERRARRQLRALCHGHASAQISIRRAV